MKYLIYEVYLYYTSQYGQVASIASHAIVFILEFYEKNETDFYYKKAHIHQLVILLRYIFWYRLLQKLKSL